MYSRQLPPNKKRRVGSWGDRPPAGGRRGPNLAKTGGGIAVGHTKMPAKPLRRSPRVLDGSITGGPGRPHGTFLREG